VAFAFVSSLVHFNLVYAPYGLVLAGVNFAAPYAPQSCDFNGIDIGIGVRVVVVGFYLTKSEHAVQGKSKNRIITHPLIQERTCNNVRKTFDDNLTIFVF
jgi:hypothetical protein